MEKDNKKMEKDDTKIEKNWKKWYKNWNRKGKGKIIGKQENDKTNNFFSHHATEIMGTLDLFLE